MTADQVAARIEELIIAARESISRLPRASAPAISIDKRCRLCVLRISFIELCNGAASRPAASALAMACRAPFKVMSVWVTFTVGGMGPHCARPAAVSFRRRTPTVCLA